ncbi:prothymosin alpha [Echinops telfairi]|uniref:Prothymosin alpha n=1 Tax=Echinops telfairi TaxID=9371 RepID=A0AC55DKA9_ECHTE|nr:prothymosin alpha [Echinops telfairi]
MEALLGAGLPLLGSRPAVGEGEVWERCVPRLVCLARRVWNLCLPHGSSPKRRDGGGGRPMAAVGPGFGALGAQRPRSPRWPCSSIAALCNKTFGPSPCLFRRLTGFFLNLLKDLKEKKEVVEEAENGREAPANGNANEENGEQEADNEVDEEEEEGGEEEDEEEEGDGEEEDEDEEAEAATGKRAAEDDEDDDVDTKKQKTDEDD